MAEKEKKAKPVAAKKVRKKTIRQGGMSRVL